MFWTSPTDTHRHVGLDVPDYMPEERPGVILAAYRAQTTGQFLYDSDILAWLRTGVACHHPTETITDCLLRRPPKRRRRSMYVVCVIFLNAIPCVLITVGI